MSHDSTQKQKKAPVRAAQTLLLFRQAVLLFAKKYLFGDIVVHVAQVTYARFLFRLAVARKQVLTAELAKAEFARAGHQLLQPRAELIGQRPHRDGAVRMFFISSAPTLACTS